MSITEAAGATSGTSATNTAVSGAAAPSTAAAATASTVSTGATTDWTSGLNEEVKGYVTKKGFKDPAMVLDSYVQLEKLIGVPKERLLKLPEKADDAAGWNEIHDRLGRPKTAKEYGIKSEDAAFVDWAQTTFHELGLSKAQGEKLIEKFGGFAKAQQSVSEGAKQAEFTKQDGSLKSDWGAAYDQNINVGKRAVAELGIDAPTIDKLEAAMGFAGVMKLFHKLGSQVGESTFHNGSGTPPKFNGAMTPAQALARIQALRQDNTFVTKFINGGADEKAEMAQLHEWAFAAS